MNRSRWLLLVSFALVPSCVQVLGLEEASLDDGTPSTPVTSSVASARSRLSCDNMPGAGCPCEQAPGPACTACLLRECEGAELDCVSDPHCRAELGAYAVCLGRGCGGEAEQEACTSKLSEPLLKQCVIDCQSECRQTKLVSPCELYCACLADHCADQLPLPSSTDCVKTCESWDADVRDCRRDHCEYGRGDPTHCMHASDRLHVCVDEDERSADDRNVCLDKSESTWACDFRDECCSGVCNSGVCK